MFEKGLTPFLCFPSWNSIIFVELLNFKISNISNDWFGWKISNRKELEFYWKEGKFFLSYSVITLFQFHGNIDKKLFLWLNKYQFGLRQTHFTRFLFQLSCLETMKWFSSQTKSLSFSPKGNELKSHLKVLSLNILRFCTSFFLDNIKKSYSTHIRRLLDIRSNITISRKTLQKKFHQTLMLLIQYLHFERLCHFFP